MTNPKRSSKNKNVGTQARAVVKYVRIAPRKVRPVIDTIRFQRPAKAFNILAAINKKGARMVEKLLKTAVANAHVLGMDETRLMISDVRADGGPVMKRFMARSMGRADRILKKMTHLSMVLTERGGSSAASTTLQAKAEEKTSPKAAKTEKAAKGGKKKAAAAKA
jgi:large subunit ribosomal protein L22